MAGLNLKPEEGDRSNGIDDKVDRCHVMRGHTEKVQSVIWAPRTAEGGARILASASYDGTARIWDADQGTCLHTLDRFVEVVYGLNFHPTAEYLAVGSNDRRVCIYRVKVSFSINLLRQANLEHVQNGELIAEYIHGGSVYEVLWHPNRPQIAVTGEHPDAAVLNVAGCL